jgi:hypothetical protein
MRDAKDSYHEPRVPDGVPYCHLTAAMQAVTIVYLNCFVDECLTYLYALLYFQPAPLADSQEVTPVASAGRASSRATPSRSGGARASALHRQSRSAHNDAALHTRGADARRKATLEQLAMAILLDVKMEAPVIEMPRRSTSEDSLELDLGTLKLTNHVALLRGATQAVDLMEVKLEQVRACVPSEGHAHYPAVQLPAARPSCFRSAPLVNATWTSCCSLCDCRLCPMLTISHAVVASLQVSARVLSGDKEGDNLIKQLERGLDISITRALVDPGLSLPYLDCHIDVPHVLASITDDEYAFCCNVALSNLREPMRLPQSALWVQKKVNAVPAKGRPPAAEQFHDVATPCTSRTSLGSVKEASPRPTAAAPAVSSRLRATLSFGTVELALRNAHKTSGTTSPLALLHSSNLFINYVSEGAGHMDVRICLPRVEAHDQRAARRARSSLVLSSSYHVTPAAGSSSQGGDGELVGPSLLTLHYVCHSDGAQDVAMRVQRPTVVAEVDFMAAMLSFVAPSLMLGADPMPFLDRDVQCAPTASVLKLRHSLSTARLLFGNQWSAAVESVCMVTLSCQASLDTSACMGLTSGWWCSLSHEVTTAADHIWLSPSNRLLADSPLLTSYTLDLDHHSLVLPPDLIETANMPLIVLGADCTLRVTNGAIYNAGSLAACLAMGPGAHFFAEESDGVDLHEDGPLHLSDPVAAMEATQAKVHGSFAVSSVVASRAPSTHFQVCAGSVCMLVTRSAAPVCSSSLSSKLKPCLWSGVRNGRLGSMYRCQEFDGLARKCDCHSWHQGGSSLRGFADLIHVPHTDAPGCSGGSCSKLCSRSHRQATLQPQWSHACIEPGLHRSGHRPLASNIRTQH